MSRKYPFQNAADNIKANRARQRAVHTDHFYYQHRVREQNEEAAAKIAAFRAANPNYKKPIRSEQAQPTMPANNGVTLGTSAGGAATGAAAAGTEGFAAVCAGAGAGALGVVAALGAVSAGAATALNNTVLRDEPSLSSGERDARAAGRVASYSGAAVGTVATVGAIGASGSVVGLSGAGIVSGVAAIGGGSVALGTVAVVAAPAALALAVGYGIYRLWKA